MKKLLFSLLLAGGVQNSLAMQGGGAAQGGRGRCTAFLKQLKQKYSEPPIITAVKENNLALVEQLIDMGENVNSCDQSARTALMFAANSGNCQIAKALVDAGADVNASGISLLTPLMYAASNGHIDVVDMLIASGKLNINAQDQRNQTALMLARDNGHEDVTARLFQAGARNEKVFVQFKDSSIHSLELARLRALNSSLLNNFLDNDSIECNTEESAPIPLHKFADLQDFSEFEALVKCPLGGNQDKLIDFLKKADFLEINIVNMLKDLKNKNWHTSYNICKCLLSENPDFVIDLQKAFPEILIKAIDLADLAFARLLIETGIDVNTVDNSVRGVIIYAFNNGNFDANIVKLLITAGADVNTVDSSGRGLIGKAIDKENIEIAKLLITAGANVNTKVKTDCPWIPYLSVLNWAISEDYQEFVPLCIKAGADLNNIDDGHDNNDGVRTLMYACCIGDTEILGLLITAGIDVNVIEKGDDADNETALICAARRGMLNVVQALIKAGADVNACDDNGWTALIQAAENGHTEIARILIDAGAYLNIRAADDGCTALIKAVQNGYTEIVKLLIEAGADLDIKASDGCTALNYATRNGHKEIAGLLVSANAYFDAKDDPILVKLLTQ